MKGEIDDILRQAVAAGHVPGVAAVVVDADGVLYEGAAGEREIGTGEAMTLDTVGAIHSMTKAITAAAAMCAVEDGLLQLDRPAGEICPELAEVQVLDGWDEGGEPILREPRSPVTLRNLLTHTSGLTYDLWNADTARFVEHTGMPGLGSGELAGLRQPLAFDPGTRWEYGIGIDWAGRLIEAVTGTRLGEFMNERIFEPLGMVDTGFRWKPVDAERAAAMHLRQPDGSFRSVGRPEQEAREFDEGGGGLRGTMPDYARFLQMILRGGEFAGRRVLAAETVDQMARNHIGDLRVQILTTTNPVLSADAEFFPGTAKSWGLSWQIDEEPQFTGRPAGTLMWAGLANCFHWIDRHNGIAGCYMSQILPFADERTLSTYLDVERAVYAAR